MENTRKPGFERLEEAVVLHIRKEDGEIMKKPATILRNPEQS